MKAYTKKGFMVKGLSIYKKVRKKGRKEGRINLAFQPVR